MKFNLNSKYKPTGDQPQAIKKLNKSIENKNRFQTLLGVTGSGKTFTMANVIEKIQKPTLVIAHNKTLAAQLVQEFRDFFPDNAVEYFVSYYDYYQPEAYIPTSDTYIEKDASINEEIDRMRTSATEALLSRKDVIVISSVSCIYGLGNPENYRDFIINLNKKDKFDRRQLIEELIDIGYERSEDPLNGTFRIRANSIEIASTTKDRVYRIEFSVNKIKSIQEFEAVSHEHIKDYNEISIFPARHFVLDKSDLDYAIPKIKHEMQERVKYFLKKNLYLEAERLERRVSQDIAMLREVGYVGGIENYSRFLTKRKPGEPPYTLIDYFENDFLTIIDESHVTVPQIGGMYNGDLARKKNLVKYGFRLPSAKDNRPLKFDEFLDKVNQMVFVSATPGKFESKHSKNIIEQIIRPTGLLDPKLTIRDSKTQVKDIVSVIQKMKKESKDNNPDRVLITTLTKKTAEDLSQFLKEAKIKSCYLHSDIDTMERIRIINDLRKGKYHVLVGVNLLREGLDLPEVSLVAILDADKEGFLRNETSLIQTIGRAARHQEGKVILYKEKITKSLKKAIDETSRRRKIQLEYNKKHNITPKSIKKQIRSIAKEMENNEKIKNLPKEYTDLNKITNLKKYIKDKTGEMKKAADNMEFEKAAMLRDEIQTLKNLKG